MPSKKVAIVTGANTGLGYETALGLAKAGVNVVLGCRNGDKAQAAMTRIRQAEPDAELDFIPLDLVDRTSIREFAGRFRDEYDTLDILVNNAGVMGPPYTITPNGVELQFDGNHLGHFLLTSLLMKPLEAAEAARIINVSSLAAKREWAAINFDNLNFDGIYNDVKFMGLTGMGAYSQSKLANALFTIELKDRLAAAGKNIKTMTVHPGASNTDLSRYMPAMTRFLAPVLAPIMGVSTPEEGAQSSLMAALEPSVEAGDFIGPTGPKEFKGPPGKVDLPNQASDKALCERLWTVSEELLGIEFKV